jgi:hypothetical protein
VLAIGKTAQIRSMVSHSLIIKVSEEPEFQNLPLAASGGK